MKPRIIILMLSGLLAGSMAVSAQNNPPAADDTNSASDTVTNATMDQQSAATGGMVQESESNPTNAAAQPAETTAEAGVASTNVSVEPLAATNESAVAGEEVTDTNEMAASAVESTNELVMSQSQTNAAAATNAPIIPLVVMDDVPLTDAIKNLARQANLNYMLDPKLNYGQIGPDGRPVPQPTVSIRWENVTAEQALNALLSNYGLQLVEDPKTDIARVTIKDPKAPEPLMTKIIQLKYASPSNILAAVRTTLTDRRSRVMADVRTSQLVVVATEKEQDEVQHLVVRLDKPTRQVLIEARLLETSINPTSVKGIDWTGTLQGQHVGVGNNLQQAPVPQDSQNAPLATSWPKLMLDTAKGFNPATAFLDADGVNLLLSYLNTYAETKIISTPRTVTMDNETAHIEVGQDYPIINITAGTANTTGGSHITYSNLTVRLDVTPRISANDYVNLKVTPHVMRLDSVKTFIVGGQPFDVPIFDTRTLATSVMIPSGNTLVMGGLMQDDVANQSAKVPLLGDIPGLGYVFRKDTKSRTKSNMLIFITPTIVQDADFQPTKTDFLKTPVPQAGTVEPDWSAWNSGKAYDWGKRDSQKDKPVYQNPE